MFYNTKRDIIFLETFTQILREYFLSVNFWLFGIFLCTFISDNFSPRFFLQKIHKCLQKRTHLTPIYISPRMQKKLLQK